MATGHKEMKTPMELAMTKGKSKALTVLGQYTKVNTFWDFACFFAFYLHSDGPGVNAKGLVALKQYVYSSEYFWNFFYL